MTPDEIASITTKAEELIKTGALNEARTLLDTLPRDAKIRGSVLLLQLRIIRNEKDWQTAAVMGTNLTVFMPYEASVWFTAALAYAHLGEIARATPHLQRALALEPSLMDEALSSEALSKCLVHKV